MSGHLRRSDAAEDGGERVERQELAGHLEPSRNADPEQLARCPSVAKHALGARTFREDQDHHAQLEPLRRRGREAAPRDAEPGEPPASVDQAVGQERVHDVPADADGHRSSDVTERLPIIDERQQRPHRGSAEGHRREEVAREGDHRRVELEEDEERRQVASEEPHDEPDRRAEECAGRRVASPVLGPFLSDRERRPHLHRARQPEDERIAEEQQRRRDPHARERVRPEPADELRVDETE